jgi:hypothetical protein
VPLDIVGDSEVGMLYLVAKTGFCITSGFIYNLYINKVGFLISVFCY